MTHRCCFSVFSLLSENGSSFKKKKKKEFAPLGLFLTLLHSERPKLYTIALSRAKIVYNFGLSGCNSVKGKN